MITLFDLSVIGIAGSTAALVFAKLTGKEKLENRAVGIFAFAFSGFILTLNHYDEPHLWRLPRSTQASAAGPSAIPQPR